MVRQAKANLPKNVELIKGGVKFPAIERAGAYVNLIDEAAKLKKTDIKYGLDPCLAYHCKDGKDYDKAYMGLMAARKRMKEGKRIPDGANVSFKGFRKSNIIYIWNQE